MKCEWALEGRASGVGAAVRAELLARALGWPEKRASQIRLVVSELVSNAIRHGGGGRCRFHVSQELCRVEVEDRGAGFPQWVLEHDAKGLPIEPALVQSATPRAGGLGAGLDCARRLSNELKLKNLPAGGGVAMATFDRNRVSMLD